MSTKIFEEPLINPLRAHRYAKRWFQLLDEDQDQKLNKREIRKLQDLIDSQYKFNHHDGSLIVLMRHLDPENNGYITIQDFERFLRKYFCQGSGMAMVDPIEQFNQNEIHLFEFTKSQERDIFETQDEESVAGVVQESYLNLDKYNSQSHHQSSAQFEAEEVMSTHLKQSEPPTDNIERNDSIRRVSVETRKMYPLMQVTGQNGTNKTPHSPLGMRSPTEAKPGCEGKENQVRRGDGAVNQLSGGGVRKVIKVDNSKNKPIDQPNIDPKNVFMKKKSSNHQPEPMLSNIQEINSSSVAHPGRSGLTDYQKTQEVATNSSKQSHHLDNPKEDQKDSQTQRINDDLDKNFPVFSTHSSTKGHHLHLELEKESVEVVAVQQVEDPVKESNPSKKEKMKRKESKNSADGSESVQTEKRSFLKANEIFTESIEIKSVKNQVNIHTVSDATDLSSERTIKSDRDTILSLSNNKLVGMNQAQLPSFKKKSNKPNGSETGNTNPASKYNSNAVNMGQGESQNQQPPSPNDYNSGSHSYRSNNFNSGNYNSRLKNGIKNSIADQIDSSRYHRLESMKNLVSVNSNAQNYGTNQHLDTARSNQSRMDSSRFRLDSTRWTKIRTNSINEGVNNTGSRGNEESRVIGAGPGVVDKPADNGGEKAENLLKRDTKVPHAAGPKPLKSVTLRTGKSNAEVKSIRRIDNGGAETSRSRSRDFVKKVKPKVISHHTSDQTTSSKESDDVRKVASENRQIETIHERSCKTTVENAPSKTVCRSPIIRSKKKVVISGESSSKRGRTYKIFDNQNPKVFRAARDFGDYTPEDLGKRGFKVTGTKNPDTLTTTPKTATRKVVGSRRGSVLQVTKKEVVTKSRNTSVNKPKTRNISLQKPHDTSVAFSAKTETDLTDQETLQATSREDRLNQISGQATAGQTRVDGLSITRLTPVKHFKVQVKLVSPRSISPHERKPVGTNSKKKAKVITASRVYVDANTPNKSKSPNRAPQRSKDDAGKTKKQKSEATKQVVPVYESPFNNTTKRCDVSETRNIEIVAPSIHSSISIKQHKRVVEGSNSKSPVISTNRGHRMRKSRNKNAGKSATKSGIQHSKSPHRAVNSRERGSEKVRIHPDTENIKASNIRSKNGRDSQVSTSQRKDRRHSRSKHRTGMRKSKNQHLTPTSAKQQYPDNEKKYAAPSPSKAQRTTADRLRYTPNKNSKKKPEIMKDFAISLLDSHRGKKRKEPHPMERERELRDPSNNSRTTTPSKNQKTHRAAVSNTTNVKRVPQSSETDRGSRNRKVAQRPQNQMIHSFQEKPTNTKPRQNNMPTNRSANNNDEDKENVDSSSRNSGMKSSCRSEFRDMSDTERIKRRKRRVRKFLSRYCKENTGYIELKYMASILKSIIDNGVGQAGLTKNDVKRFVSKFHVHKGKYIMRADLEYYLNNL